MSYNVRTFLLYVLAIAIFKIVCGVHKPSTHYVENKAVHSATQY